jgi:hypothetical protein
MSNSNGQFSTQRPNNAQFFTQLVDYLNGVFVKQAVIDFEVMSHLARSADEVLTSPLWMGQPFVQVTIDGVGNQAVPANFWKLYQKIQASSASDIVNIMFTWPISGPPPGEGIPLVAVTSVRTCLVGDNPEATNRIIAHEIGHALGLAGHSWPGDNLMFLGADTKLLKGQADTIHERLQ